jgi:hypothetical protein
MRAKLIFKSSKPFFTTCLNGSIIKENSTYYCVYFHGFMLFNKTFTNRLFFNNDVVTHFLGFRFTKSYFNESQIRYNKGFL